MKIHLLLPLVLFITIVAGCTPAPVHTVTPSLSFSDRSLDEFIQQRQEHINSVMASIEKRNQGIEKNPLWISWAYSALDIKKLPDIPASQYSEYAKYLDTNKSVYIIVHPSYYLFFHSKKPQIARDADNLNESIVDVFLKELSENAIIRMEQEQQRNEKQFIEYLSMDDKLVILLLPRNYSRASNYTYRHTVDEYARYLNEIANGSPSVIYMESESSSVGRLLSEDLIQLLSFLEAVGAKSVLIGGGYVGRCQKEFYSYVTKYSFGSNYFIVPEISTFSPDDVTETAAKSFIEQNLINVQASSEFVVNKTPSNTNLQHLPLQYINTVVRVATKKTEGIPGNTREIPPAIKPADKQEEIKEGIEDIELNYCY